MMDTASLSGVIIAPSSDTEEQPCQVIQQQDTEDTAPCISGAGNALNQMLSLLGIEIPAPKESETYRSTLTVKPKNVYTSINISLTHGDLSSPKYNSLINEARIDVSTGDWRLDNGNYYIDIRSSSDLVESDSISSASWAAPPIDDELKKISPTPTISTTSDDKLKSNLPSNGVALVKYIETTSTYEFNIDPREEVESGFYESNLVINAEGCNNEPFFYEIKVPSCYESNRRAELLSSSSSYGGGGGGSDVTTPPPKAKGGLEYNCVFCLCSNNLKSATVDSLCPGRTGDCSSGPTHKEC